MKYAFRATAGEPVAGQLQNSIEKSQKAHRQALSLVRPLRDLEEQEATPRTVKPRRRRGSVTPTPEVIHRGNVVHGAFLQAVAGD